MPRPSTPAPSQPPVPLWRRLPALPVLIGLALTLMIATAAGATAVISASQTATIVGDDGDGRADPGETLAYTVTIANSGSSNATGMTFSNPIDGNTTLVAGSVNVSPLARNDRYETVGNTQLLVGIPTAGRPAVALAGSLFDNDAEFLNDSFALASVESVAFVAGSVTAATEQGGSVTVEADGNFAYTPPVGFSGVDNFDYVIADDGAVGSAALADAGRVTITVLAQRVWYVQNNTTTGGLGRSSDPFDTLTEAQAAAAVNDTIYVLAGNGTANGQNVGITLRDGQRLIGEGVALTVPVSVNGGPNPTTLRAAGSAPRVDAVAGSAIAAFNDIPAEIRGLSLLATANAIDITLSDSSSGALTIADNTIRGAGSEGIDINVNGSAVLTLAAQRNSWDSAGTHTGNGFDARTSASGQLRLNLSDNAGVRSSATAVAISGGGGGALTITGFANNTVSGGTAGAGVSVSIATFDAAPGGAFQTVAGGATQIGQAGDGVGGTGMTLSTVAGDLSFSDLDIVATGTGLQASGTTDYTGSAGLRLAVGANVATISSTSSAALDMNIVTADLPFQFITSSFSTSYGVSLVNLLGTLSAASGSSLANAALATFNISGGSADISYAGTITDNVGTLVSISSTTGGTKSFTGAISDGNSGIGSGVTLTNNTGATITFAGGLQLSTGASPAFTATGGGTVNICDESACNAGATGTLVNSLTTTTATALNVVNTTIGAGNLEFRSISSNGGSATAIILNGTGANPLVVKGNGAISPQGGNGSGGTITNKTGGTDGDGATASGIFITNGSATLRHMSLTRLDNFGLYGISVNSLTLQYSTVGAIAGSACADSDGDIGSSTAAQDAAIVFGRSNPSGLNGFNVGGSALLDSLLVRCAIEHQIEVYQRSNSFSLTVSNSTIQDNSSSFGSDGILIETQTDFSPSTPPASGTILVQGNAFNDNRLQALQALANGDSTLSVTIDNNVVQRTTQGNNGFILSNRADGRLTTAITSNNITDLNGSSIIVRQSFGETNTLAGNAVGLTAIIRGNTLITPGATSNETINVQLTSTISQVSRANILIETNTITQNANNNPISIDTPDSNTLPEYTITIINNDITVASANNGDISFLARQGVGCFDVRNNRISGPFGIFMLQSSPGAAQLERGIVSSTNAASVLNINNQLGAVPVIQGTIAVVDNNTCLPAPVAQVPGGASSAVAAAPLPKPAPSTGAEPPGHQEAASPAGSTSGSASRGDARSAARPGLARPAAHGVGPAAPGSDVNWRSRVPPAAPLASGETVDITIGTLPAGESLTVVYRVTVDSPLTFGAGQISSQGTVAGSNFSSVLTDDPSVAGASDPTRLPLDRPNTTVTSISRAGASPNNGASVSWTVTFANALSGLSSGNFFLANTGLGGSPAITSVTPVGAAPATQWTVTASTGTSQGDLGLDMVNDTGLTSELTNLSFTGEFYSVDLVAPATSAFLRRTPATERTNADSLVFRVDFSERVANVGAADFTASGTTATVTSITVVDLNAGTYDVTIAGGNLASVNGTVGLNFSAGMSISDPAGNPLPGSEPATDETYNLDNTAPTVLSFTRFDPASSPTNADSLVFEVRFSEQVAAIGNADFAVGGASTAGILDVGIINTNGLYRVTVAGGDLAGFNGAVGLSFSASAALTDLAGNPFVVAEPPTDETYSVDNTAPGLIAITRFDPAGSATNADSLVFSARFSEPIAQLSPGDFQVGGASSAAVSGVGVIAAGRYSVTVAGGDLAGFNGAVGLNVSPSAALTDLAGNPFVVAEPPTDETYSVDNTAPTATVEQAAGQADPTSRAPIVFTVSFSEPVTGFAAGDLTLGGTAPGSLAGIVTGGPSSYTVSVSGMAGDGTVVASLAAGAAQDAAGNSSAASTSADNSVTFDAVPLATAIVRAAADPSSAAEVAFTVTFSEAVTGVDPTDFSVAASGVTGAAVTTVTGSGATRTVTVSTGSGSGSLGLNLADDDSIVNLGGEQLGGPGAGNGDLAGPRYTIDRVAPQAGGLSAPSLTLGGGADYTFTLVFSDNLALDLSSLDGGDVRVTGPGGFNTLATLISATPAGDGSPRTATYRIAAPGGAWDDGDNGSYSIALEAGQVRDTAGNPAAGGALGGFTVAISPPRYTVHLPLI